MPKKSIFLAPALDHQHLSLVLYFFISFLHSEVSFSLFLFEINSVNLNFSFVELFSSLSSWNQLSSLVDGTILVFWCWINGSRSLSQITCPSEPCYFFLLYLSLLYHFVNSLLFADMARREILGCSDAHIFEQWSFA